MLENIYEKILSSKIIEIIKNNKKYRRLFIISIFLLNLSIYSIPLLLFHLEIVKIPQNFIISYTKTIYHLDILNIDKKIEDNVITIKDFRFYFDQQCLGIKSIFSLFAIILSTPIKSFRKRIKYFLILFPFIFILNILRIYSTIYLFYYFNLNPYLVHDFLWEIANFLFILLVWYIFYRKVKNEIILSF